MEEDLKILEELIEEYKDCSVEGLDMQVDVSFREKQCNAIEHLIKGYKQLKEENIIYGLEGCRVRLKMYIDENYIPTSLVKEKIEDLEKRGYFEGADAMKDLLERSREDE